MGLTVLPPDINASDRPYTGKDRTIRMGLMQLRGLKEKALDHLLEEREAAGPYRSFEDFQSRLRLDPSDVRILVKAGCLDSIAGGRSRAELLWQTEAGRHHRPATSQSSLDLFAEEAVSVPRLGNYDFRTALMHEVEILGFPLCVHPLDLYREAWEGMDLVRGDEIAHHVGERVTMIGWWVMNKMVYTKQEEPMAFISFEDTTAMYETIFFPPAFRKYCSRFSPVRPYVLEGVIEDDLGAVSLHVEEMRYLRGGEIRRKKKNLPNARTQLPKSTASVAAVNSSAKSCSVI